MKKYSNTNTKGNKGESIFVSVISDYAVPHQIERSNDIGVDFLCEWKNGESPTGVVFAVQVKYRSDRTAKFVKKDLRLNHLNEYTISPSISIDKDTTEYWKLLGMPTYLFVIIPNESSVDIFYKRYTPILTGNKTPQAEMPFYKVNDGLSFLPFSNMDNKVGGFTRDLYIDQIRANYSKGQITYMNPQLLGLNQFPAQDKDIVFRDIFDEYQINFEETFEQLRKVFADEYQAQPSEAPPGSEDY